LPTPQSEKPAEHAPASREVAAPTQQTAAPATEADPVQPGATTRRSTLRFPPPPSDAVLHAARELAAVTGSSHGVEKTTKNSEKFGEAPQARGAQPGQALAEPRSAPRLLEPGYIVAPASVDGGRVEWTIDAPLAVANDTHRSMSHAVAAAEHEQRTVRADRERPAAKRERAAAAPVSADVREPREAAERPREIEPIVAVAETRETIAAAAPETPAFTMHGQPARQEPSFERVSASVASLPDPRLSESRERRQDDAEVTVSQMTLSHRVEARTVVDDLGAITVRADIRDGQVDVKIAAERVETVAFLDQNRADLTRDLKISSPQVNDVSVRADAGGNGSRRDQQPQRQANDNWGAGTPSSMAAASTDTRVVSANGKRVRIVL
jgi:hypothetical protein